MNMGEYRTERAAENGRRKGDDWKLQAPRWVLLALVMAASVYIGIQYQENHYLEASLQDGPSKFQQRQGERLASLEAEVRGLTKAVEVSNAKDDQRDRIVIELTEQVRQLMRARR